MKLIETLSKFKYIASIFSSFLADVIILSNVLKLIFSSIFELSKRGIGRGISKLNLRSEGLEFLSSIILRLSICSMDLGFTVIFSSVFGDNKADIKLRIIIIKKILKKKDSTPVRTFFNKFFKKFISY